jgi:hypothetical protein
MRTKLVVGGLTVAVAFLVATNPVVVEAAGQITSGQIKNETIKSKDVKNNALKGADLKDASVGIADLAPEVTSKLGSSAYVFRLPKEPTSTEQQSYLLTGLPAGTYAFQYSVMAQMGAAGQQIFCAVHVVPGSGEPNIGAQYGSTSAGLSSASAGGVLVKGAGPSELVCVPVIGGTMTLQGQPDGTNASTITLIPMNGSTSTTVAP